MQAEEIRNVNGRSTGLAKLMLIASTKTIVHLVNHFLNDDELIFYNIDFFKEYPHLNTLDSAKSRVISSGGKRALSEKRI
jgi:hypothetical protein